MTSETLLALRSATVKVELIEEPSAAAPPSIS
jgi:hypothetical protein